jgi:hypothetical protein
VYHPHAPAHSHLQITVPADGVVTLHAAAGAAIIDAVAVGAGAP